MLISHSAQLAIVGVVFGAFASAGALGSAGASRLTGRVAAQQGGGCNRIASTSFTFGLTGGNLKPSGLRIAANGVVSRVGEGSDTAHTRAVSTRALRDLARRAWNGAFVRLPTAPTRPTQNPDAARRYVELHSACGAKHVEYASGDEAPAFRDLYTRLDALTRPR